MLARLRSDLRTIATATVPAPRTIASLPKAARPARCRNRRKSVDVTTPAVWGTYGPPVQLRCDCTKSIDSRQRVHRTESDCLFRHGSRRGWFRMSAAVVGSSTDQAITSLRVAGNLYYFIASPDRTAREASAGGRNASCHLRNVNHRGTPWPM